MDERNYCVYKHTFPDGWTYVGMTKNPRTRWDGGHGYADNSKMFRAIVRYGWDNITHEIVKDGMDRLEAEQYEMELIKKCSENGKSFNRKCVANQAKDKKSWIDSVITEETLKQYAYKFTSLNDDWIEPYAGKSGMVSGVTLLEDRVEIEDYRYDKDRAVAWKVVKTIYYPCSNITYRDLIEYLFTKPKAETRKEQEFPVVGLLLNMLNEYK